MGDPVLGDRDVVGEIELVHIIVVSHRSVQF